VKKLSKNNENLLFVLCETCCSLHIYMKFYLHFSDQKQFNFDLVWPVQKKSVLSGPLLCIVAVLFHYGPFSFSKPIERASLTYCVTESSNIFRTSDISEVLCEIFEFGTSVLILLNNFKSIISCCLFT